MQLRHPAKYRFIVFGQGRTGSTLLVNLLNSHPDILCEGELMNPYFWNRISRRTLLPLFQRYPLPYFNFKAYTSPGDAYGFKLFADHCRHIQAVVARMHQEGWRVILVRRQDTLAQALSSAAALTTHHWHRSEDNPASSIAMILPPDLVLKRLTHYADGKKLIGLALAGIPYLEITYETDLQDPAAWKYTSARLLQYLNLPIKTLSAPMRKTYDQAYPDIIRNYSEILDAIRGSGFSSILSETV